MDLFNKKKVRVLEDTIKEIKKALSCITQENDDLRNKNKEKDKYIEALEMSLETALNDVKKGNTRINSLLTEVKLLKNENLELKQLVEIKENQRRKNAGKVGGLTKENKELNDRIIGLNELVKSLNKDVCHFRDLSKTNKSAKSYLKGKAERE